MGTLSEEILSANIGKTCFANDIIIAKIDYVMSHDTTTPLIINALEEFENPVFDKDKTLIFFDHIVPAASIQAAELQKQIRSFIRENQIVNVYQEGISHQLMVEKRIVYPGAVIVGADSHTCTYGALGCFSTGMGSTDIAIAYTTGKTWFKVPETINIQSEGNFPKGVFPKDLSLSIIGKIGVEGANYQAVEYTGSTITAMSIEERMTLTNMAIEMGAKTGLIEADDKTMEYVHGKGTAFKSDNPTYSKELYFDIEDLTPQIAAPHSVDNVYDITKFNDLSVDQVFIGTCTNGRISDLEIVARILKGRTVHPDTRLIIGPASASIQMEAYKRGYIDIFIQAGAIVINPGCGPCIGRHEGVLASNEVALTTMNRNFRGRMGSPDADIYLVSPASAAVASITGKVGDPREWV